MIYNSNKFIIIRLNKLTILLYRNLSYYILKSFIKKDLISNNINNYCINYNNY